ncbi:SusC/RagA family TonB-linked outer membrane protein [Deminuibacter soli]|uniref:SusC/RagA family TonB-linked outer membrane protein n=1 Tax=Deminuibacter soli TaxID=2291815 RepID=UPI0013146698|nr:SusC/RagA family TonB-linked outer membrane protein [Deminuibacter soli]
MWRQLPYKKIFSVYLAAFFLLAGTLPVCAKGNAQTVTLAYKHIPLEQVLKNIETQTGYTFIYISSDIAGVDIADISVSNASLEYALQQCFRGLSLTYTIDKKYIVLKKQVNTPPADGDISGRVLNEKGEPIAGATVMIKGAQKMTATDAGGRFVFKNTAGSILTLIIKYVGYAEKEISASGPVEVRLEASANELDEMVVRGYYNTTKRLSVGNVTTINADVIAKQPVSNPILALQGRVPGMVIISGSGLPGSAVGAQIRGINSIGQSGTPLYLVDGVPYTSSLLPGTTSPLPNASPFQYINPADIESISVLKDADATAIYGSRGANGVVLITTKKGRVGPVSTTLNVYNGYSKLGRDIKLLSTPQYLEMRREAFKNDNRQPGPTDYDLNGAWDTAHYTNWVKELINQPARVTDAQLSVSGGSGQVQYVFGGGYRKETPMFGGGFSDQKITGHFSMTIASPNRRFKTTIAANYLADNNLMSVGDLTNSITLAPVAPPLRKPDGSINFDSGRFTANPLVPLANHYSSKGYNLVCNGIASYEIVPGLQIKMSLGYNNLQVNEVTAYSIYGQTGNPNIPSPVGSSTFSFNNTRSWIVEPQLAYEKRISKGNLNAFVGATLQQSTNEGQMIQGDGYTNDAFLTSLAAAVTISKAGTPVYNQYRYTALYGRLSYNYNEKYIVNITARRDGSSRFGPGRQYGNFGAVGAGWIFTSEKFISQNLSFLNYGKLRVSYGSVGNQPTSDYQYLELYRFNTPSVPYQGGASMVPSKIYAPDFRWEINKKFEAGLELGFLKNRLMFTGSYFRNRSGNQLVNYALPGITGFTSITANFPAIVQNTGWEFTLNSTNLRTKNFTWSTAFNISTSSNKLVAFPGLATSPYSSNYFIGKAINLTRLYRYAGIDSLKGIYQFYTYKGGITSTPTDSDRTSLIQTAPKYYGGFDNIFTYKRFSLDVFFYFVKQMGVKYAFTRTGAPGVGRVNNVTSVLDRWQHPGDKAAYQRFTSTSGEASTAYSNALGSDYAYTDASYVRLKNLSLSYEVPLAKLNSTRTLRIYLQGQNLLTITKYKDGDPESRTSTGVPIIKTYTIGAQLNF